MEGETLGSYRVTRKLGEGGMGQVFEGEHVLLGTKRAIKLLRPQVSALPEVVKRFFQEARAATLIGHPSIVDVLEYGHHTDGSAYFVMELLRGEPLSSRLKREGRLPPELIVAIAVQLAEALVAAHAQQIVHRDLKPDNVYLSPDSWAPGGLRVKVLDFGIAKFAPELVGEAGAHTATGAVMGTPAYMSPEQCRGAGQVDHRSDIYSFGCILFEMACGRWVFQGQGTGDFISKHMHQPPPAPRSIEPSVPVALEASILRCLQKSPDDRYDSMAAILAELRRLLPTGQLAVAWPEMELPPSLIPPRDEVMVPGGTKPQRPRAAAPSPPVDVPRTTLGGAASQSVAQRQPISRRTKLAALIIGASATVAIAVAAIGLSGGKKKERFNPAPATSPPPDAAAVTPAARVHVSPPARPVDAGIVGVVSPAPPDAGPKQADTVQGKHDESARSGKRRTASNPPAEQPMTERRTAEPPKLDDDTIKRGDGARPPSLDDDTIKRSGDAP